jgi:hypothetical protein
MIVFNLSCNNDHRFEGWFETSAKFEAQKNANLLSCPVCGTDQVNKELHAPYVNTGTRQVSEVGPQQSNQALMHVALSKFVEHVIANTEDVGTAFPEEARKIHYSEVPERAIRGSASPDEIKDLHEEGIEIVSVPIPKYRLGNPH